MTRLKQSISTVLAGLLVASAAAAQDVEEDVREYTVEVIVFSYEEDVSVGSEQFLPDEPEPVSLMPDFFTMPVGAAPVGTLLPEPEEPAEDRVEEAPVDDLPLEPVEVEFLLSPEALLELNDVNDSLARRSTYRPLLHAAWTQEALPEGEALVMNLDRITNPPASLSGEFTLYLSRFLHLVVDLEFQRNGESQLPVALEWPGSEAAPLTYRINEDRIFRSGETRYYDHPRFGVIARVTRVEEPEPEDDEDALTDQVVN